MCAFLFHNAQGRSLLAKHCFKNAEHNKLWLRPFQRLVKHLIFSGVGSGFSQQTLQREDTQEIIKSSMVSKIEHDLKQRYKIFVDRYEVNFYMELHDLDWAAHYCFQNLNHQSINVEYYIKITRLNLKDKLRGKRQWLSKYETGRRSMSCYNWYVSITRYCMRIERWWNRLPI